MELKIATQNEETQTLDLENVEKKSQTFDKDAQTIESQKSTCDVGTFHKNLNSFRHGSSRFLFLQMPWQATQ